MSTIEGAPPPPYSHPPASTFIADLERLVELKNAGMLSEDEFKLAKQKVIAANDDSVKAGNNANPNGSKQVQLYNGKQVVQFRVSDCKCNDELDDYHFWLSHDGISYSELPPELQGVQGFTLNHWQSILDDISQIIDAERCDCPLCCLMTMFCTIVVGCIYCQAKGSNVKNKVLAKCKEYDRDWSTRFGINVIPATVHPSYIQFPNQGQKHIQLPTLKDRGTISIQLHIASHVQDAAVLIVD